MFVGRVCVSIRRAEDKLNYLELFIPATPVPAVAGQLVPPETLTAHAAWVKGQKEIVVLMIMTMKPDLQRNLETLVAYDMLKELKTLFAQQAEQELLQTVREFHAYKQEEGQSMTTTVVNNSVFKAFFEKQKLYRPNFIDWYRQLCIVLSAEDKLNYLELLIPATPVPDVAGQLVPPETLTAHAAWVKGQKEIVVLMIITMKPDLQRNLETLVAYDMLKELKTLFAQQAEPELLQTVREFHAYKQEEGQSVSSYILKMKSYIDNLDSLGHPVSVTLAVSLILVSLRKEYNSFVQNYNMHDMRKTVNELHDMLKLHEKSLPKRDAPSFHAIRVGKRNCPQYLSELPTNKKLPQGASTSGIFTIELFTFPGESWVYDTGCGTHICNTTQGSRRGRKLKPGALSLYVGNVQRAAVEAIRSVDLCFPSRLVIVLHNCHYAPSITRGVILVSRLYDDGFINRFKNDNSISVFKNNLIYFNVVPRDGIYEIVLSDYNTNVSSMYAISNKTAKLNLDSSLLWYCRLGHISKKRIKKLLLNSIDSKSFEKCVPCLSRKMTQKPYSHQMERAKDLLGLIDTDGCEALVKRDTLTKPDKLEYISIKCIFVGYPKETMGYSFYYPPENKVFVTRNAEFLENSFITQEASGSLEDLEIIQEEDTHPAENTISNHDEDRMCLNIEADKYELGDLNEPANYKAALLDPESDKWLNAMNVEMQSIKENKVWDLVNLPHNRKTVGSKWLFKKKTDMDEAVHTYKARLVAKGFTQTPRIDYEETFSPVADIAAIRILIVIAAFYDYEICQMDVKTAFLNGYLTEEEKLHIFLESRSIKKDQIGASTPAEVKRMQNVPYASAVGSIIYDVRCTHPDVAFAQNRTSRFQQNPGELHWKAVKNILKGAVDWKSTKQSIFATSSAEPEYIAASDASKEAIWVRKFIVVLGVVPTIKEPIKMYCDNTRAITIANESGITKGARHYRAKVYYLQEVIEYGDIKLEKVHTYENLADPFTKALAFPKHSKHTKNIGMLPATSTTLVVNKEFVPPLGVGRPWKMKILDDFEKNTKLRSLVVLPFFILSIQQGMRFTPNSRNEVLIPRMRFTIEIMNEVSQMRVSRMKINE
nr:zinc finger, CCHC-type [Tanacetum cinerariifolium]